MMWTRTRRVSLAVLVTLVSGEPLLAHHSLANHETTKAVRVKGTVLQFHAINPHSFIYVEEKGADGQIRRWAVEGPSVFILTRRGLQNVVKPGDTIEFCGYLPKEALMWQIVRADGRSSLAGRLITAEVLVLPDGQTHNWEDYGFHHCFAPGYRDHHSK
jgi:hypothetical protein